MAPILFNGVSVPNADVPNLWTSGLVALIGSALATACVICVVVFCACCKKKEDEKATGTPGEKAGSPSPGGKAGSEGSKKGEASAGDQKSAKDESKSPSPKAGGKSAKQATGKEAVIGKGAKSIVAAKGVKGAAKGAPSGTAKSVLAKKYTTKLKALSVKGKEEPKKAGKAAASEPKKPLAVAKSIRAPPKPKDKAKDNDKAKDKFKKATEEPSTSVEKSKKSAAKTTSKSVGEPSAGEPSATASAGAGAAATPKMAGGEILSTRPDEPAVPEPSLKEAVEAAKEGDSIAVEPIRKTMIGKTLQFSRRLG